MDSEGGALANLRGHRDLASVEKSQVLHDGQSKAGAAHIPRPGAVDPIKALEQPLQMLCWNAVAVVLHQNLVARSRLMRNRHCAILAAEFDAIVDQVGEHTLEPAHVGVHRHIRRNVVAETYVVRRCFRS